MEWLNNVVPANGSIAMEIIWSPVVELSDKDKIHITDNRNFKKDILVIFKSVDKNKPVQKKGGAVQKSSVHLVQKRPKMSIQSSAGHLRKQSAERLLLQNANTNRLQQKNLSESIKTKVQSPKFTSTVRLPLTQRNFTTEQSNNIFTFSANKSPTQTLHKSPIEMCANASAIFNEIHFTPVATHRVDRIDSNLDYLASLPTPTLEPRQFQYDISPADYTRMHRNSSTKNNLENQDPDSKNIWLCVSHPSSRDSSLLANFETPLTHTKSTAATSILIEHIKTPDLMRRQLFEEQPSNKTYNILATTATILKNIEIGGCDETSTDLDVNQTKTITTNVDISLVGTPLRKKYQSMRNLNSQLTTEQEILKINQGSMPNLNQIANFKPLDNNRYYYQSLKRDELDKVRLEEHDIIEEDNCMQNQQTADIQQYSHDINTSGTSIISTKSINEIQFSEHEILAQSSRLNLNVCLETPTTRLPSIDLSSFTFEKPLELEQWILKTPSVVKPKSDEKQKKDEFLVPRQRTQSFRSSVRVPNKLSPKKRERDSSVGAVKPLLSLYSPPKRFKTERDSLSTSRSSSSPSLTTLSSSRVSTWTGCKPKKIRIPRLSIQNLVLKKQKEERIILYNPELHLSRKFIYD